MLKRQLKSHKLLQKLLPKLNCRRQLKIKRKLNLLKTLKNILQRNSRLPRIKEKLRFFKKKLPRKQRNWPNNRLSNLPKKEQKRSLRISLISKQRKKKLNKLLLTRKIKKRLESKRSLMMPRKLKKRKRGKSKKSKRLKKDKKQYRNAKNKNKSKLKRRMPFKRKRRDRPRLRRKKRRKKHSSLRMEMLMP